jgi:hypothetical protein
MIWIPGVGEKWACGASEIERDKVDLSTRMSGSRSLTGTSAGFNLFGFA